MEDRHFNAVLLSMKRDYIDKYEFANTRNIVSIEISEEVEEHQLILFRIPDSDPPGLDLSSLPSDLDPITLLIPKTIKK